MTEKQAITRIASYCAKAERCRYDVRKKLIVWKLENDIVDKIVSQLQKENFLNEERFCRSFIKDKIRFNKWGKNKIVFELKKKQVAELIIESSFEELSAETDFETPLTKLLTTKLSGIKAKDDYDKKLKLYRFALGRGFTSDQIRKCLDKLLVGDVDEPFF